MKKFFAVMIVMIAMIALAGVTAKAGPTTDYSNQPALVENAGCSNEQISLDTTIVRMGTDPYSARAAMLVVAKDAEGKTLCNLDQMDFGTSRNTFVPWNGWPANVDDITVYTKGGVALVVFSTKRPAGTTVYAQANYAKIGNSNGMPFCYMNCNIPK